MSGEVALNVRVIVEGERSGQPRLDAAISLSQGIVSVSGASGSGKTTLLLAIAGLLRPREGRIDLFDQTLFDSERGICLLPHQRRVALVFQSLALFPHMTAWENVAYGLAAMSKSERRATAAEWLRRMRVEHRAEQRPSSLSGGEAQRVAIARALASGPRALLLDEPFSALDPGLRRDLGDELKDLVDSLYIPALLVTHHEEDAQRLGGRVVEVCSGLVRGLLEGGVCA